MLERGKKTERFGFQYPGPYKKGDIENYIQHFHKHDEDNNKLKYEIFLYKTPWPFSYDDAKFLIFE